MNEEEKNAPQEQDDEQEAEEYDPCDCEKCRTKKAARIRAEMERES